MSTPAIVATSLVCPVGLASAPACAAMRAGIHRFEEHDYLDDDGQPVITARVPRMPRTRSVRERLHWMLERALAPLLGEPVFEGLDTVALLMAFVDRPRTGADDTVASELFAAAGAQLGPRYAASLGKLDYGGGPAGFRALARAQLLLAQRQVSACVVLGLDSWLDARSLLWLAERVPLRTAERQGLIPGEAAAALLLTPAGGAPGHARLRGLGFGAELSAVDPREPLRGEGLRDAVAAALRGFEGVEALGLHEIGLRLADDAGTHAGAKEQMLLLSRLLRTRVEELPLWLPAEFTGHAGAAAGLTEIIWVSEAHARGYLPGRRALCTTASLSGERAAAVVEFAAEGGAWS